jgi:hypothetical protein
MFTEPNILCHEMWQGKSEQQSCMLKQYANTHGSPFFLFILDMKWALTYHLGFLETLH